MLALIPSLLTQVPDSTALDSLLANPKFRGAVVVAAVSDLDGNLIYQKNADLRVMPASNQKLLSTAYALNTLGTEYRPTTRFWRSDRRIVIDSPGDPLLTHRTLSDAAQRLRLDKAQSVLVRQAYAPVIPDSWEVDDLPNKYAAPVTALTVDRGSFELWNEGGFAKLRPANYGVRIRRLAGEPGARATVTYDPFQRRIDVAGSLPNATARLDTLAIPRPDIAVANMFGTYVGPTNEVPEEVPTLIIEGRPVADMVKECLPPSDNNIAEHLMLIAANREKPLGNRPYVPARASMSKFLTDRVGIDPNDLRVYDGSGMSRHNMVTARAFVRLLAWGNDQPYGEVWREAMARPGMGTLSTRLDGIAFEGKTGSLDMVAALSGYVRGQDGRDRIVSVIVNHYSCTATEARAIMDDFVRQARLLPIPST